MINDILRDLIDHNVKYRDKYPFENVEMLMSKNSGILGLTVNFDQKILGPIDINQVIFMMAVKF
jgi:hypothetical protein